MICYLTGEACAPFYYIIVLLQLTIITPWLVRIIKSNNKKVMNVLWLISPLWLLYVYVWNIMNSDNPYLFGTLFPCWFIFYYLGLRLKCGMKFTVKPFIVLLTLILSILESLFFYHKGIDNLQITQVMFGSQSYSICVIGMLMRYKDTVCHNNIFIALGNLSYGIYYIHIFILMFINKFISMLNINNWYLTWIIRYTLVLSISAIIVIVVQQTFNNNKTFLKQIGMK